MKARVLETDRLSVGSILTDVSLAFEAGSWTHIIGPNGAGKSTLVRALAGVIAPTAGEICVAGKPLHAMSYHERAQQIAYVPQRLESLPEITVLEFVMQGTFACVDGEVARKRALEALNLLGLEPLACRRIHTLSGGELQRAMIAGAVAQNTPIILLDEPTSALDLAQTHHMNGVLRALAASGKVIVTVTHDLAQAAQTADATLVLKSGSVLWFGCGFPSTEVLAKTYDMPVDLLDKLRPSGLASAWDRPQKNKKVNAEPMRVAPAHIGPSVLVLVIVLVLAPMIGSQMLNPFALDDTSAMILVQLRVPRVLWGAVSGATLAVVGASLQAMLQNPLATPYTLGLASGASLGAMIAISVGCTSLWIVPGAAFAGAVLAMSAVLVLTARFGLKNPAYCLLAGVAASMFCSALALVFQALAEPLTSQQMMRWQMGGLDVVGFKTTFLMPIIALCLVGLFGVARSLNLISVDSALALTRGVNVQRTRLMTLVWACIATALVVAVCGPISFVGLLIPMWLRRKYGADLRALIPLCACFGALFILVADTLARCIESTAYLPVGVVVAIIGVPAIVFSLKQDNERLKT